MKGVVRWAFRVLGALMALSAMGVVVAATPHFFAVDTLELIASLSGAALCCWMMAQWTRDVSSSLVWEKLYKQQFRIGLTFAIAITALFAGHAHWQAIGSRRADSYDAAEKLVQELVVLRSDQGPTAIYVSIMNRPLRSDLAAALESSHPGITIRSLEELTPEQRNPMNYGREAYFIEIDGFSYPAWRVVQIRFHTEGCGNARDYFYFDEKWWLMGASFTVGCM